MIFWNPDARIPDGISTDEFTIRPLTVGDVEPDYEAVMESKDFLRVWEQSTWPADDFTLDGNYADLDRHEQEHIRREGFTFTVFDAANTTCLGCTYLFPITSRYFTKTTVTPTSDHRYEDYEVVISFWIRTSRLADGMDHRLLDVIEPWFTDAWDFDGVLWSVSEPLTQQIEVVESRGHRERFIMQYEKDDAPYRLFSLG